MNRACTTAIILLATAPALGQDRFVVADRTNDSLWRFNDADGNGAVDEPAEVNLWFSAANGAGTPGPMNPTSLAVRFDGLALMGDQVNRSVYLLRDLNNDGDAQERGESRVAADADNASGVSFAFPTGAAFDSVGTPYIVNAGNAFGDDGIYRLDDLNADGDFQDAGEIIPYVGEQAFGAGNGPFSPQEIAFYPTNVVPLGFLRNSSADLHGVYRFMDTGGNDRADDPGEFTPYFTVENKSGILPSAGFALEFDAARPGSLYTHQIASGGVDQVIRLTDLTGDNDAQDAGEAVIVFESGEDDLSVIDLTSLPDGRLLLTDTSLDRTIVLSDSDGDGLFLSTGERADYSTNSAGLLGDIRQIAPLAGVCAADWNADLRVNSNDVFAFLTSFFDGTVDLDGDGATNSNDFFAFLEIYFGGC